METLQDLVAFVLRQNKTIVFGNLVRHLDTLYEAIRAVPQIEVAVVSPYYLFPASEDNRIRVVRSADTPCDLLVLIEPTPSQVVEKPPTAARFVVFTSHLTFTLRSESVFTQVCYFHSTTSLSDLTQRTRRLLQDQDGSVQTSNASAVHVDAVNVMTVRGRTDRVELEQPTYVLVDLTPHQTSVFRMYLAFLDAFEFLLVSKVQGWLICFAEKNGRRAFDQFVQRTLDKLYCFKFDAGNAKDLQCILPLLPFYQSGTIDREFNVDKLTFAGVEYVAPEKVEDVCKAAAMFNLVSWVGPVYRAIE